MTIKIGNSRSAQNADRHSTLTGNVPIHGAGIHRTRAQTGYERRSATKNRALANKAKTVLPQAPGAFPAAHATTLHGLSNALDAVCLDGGATSGDQMSTASSEIVG